MYVYTNFNPLTMWPLLNINLFPFSLIFLKFQNMTISFTDPRSCRIPFSMISLQQLQNFESYIVFVYPSVHIACHVYGICIDSNSVFDLVPCLRRLFFLCLLRTGIQMMLLIGCVFT